MSPGHFQQTDEDFLRKASSQKPAWKDGSTATCVLVVDDTAVLCRMEPAAADGQRRSVTLALSKEHNPTMDGRVLGVLEVSRSFGDGQYKRCGVISTPDLRRCQLTANDRQEENHSSSFWPVMEGSVEQRLAEGEVRFEAACQQLASEAVRRGCADNVTV
ncbi:hypothetical protein INR49_015060, partial [Caranx melampygus]